MNGYTLVTGSEKKAAEYRAMFPSVSIGVAHIDVDEVQSLDLEEIATKKARDAYAVLGTPVVVDDTGFFLAHWNGLPGPYIKYFEEQFLRDSLIRLLGDARDRRGSAKTCIAYCDESVQFTACGEVHGTVTEDVRGPDGAFGFDYCFIPDGYDKTFAELGVDIKNAISHRFHALTAFTAQYDKVFSEK